MSSSSAVAWLRRVCFDDYGYTFSLPALAIVSAALSQAVLRRISFTEIDFQTYVGQAALFLQGERHYANLNPEGGSGPCVYPAAHLYVYSFFHWLTDGGKNILLAQKVFAGLLTANNLIVGLLYRQVGMPPIAVLPLILSKRISSIFLLRMFNDPIAIFLAYVALFAAINARWKLSALLFSLGLGVKMNVLLFLPGIAAAAFAYTGLAGVVSYTSIIAVVQVLISLPFTWHDAHAYLAHAFDFSRAFLYVWTVNWRFVDEKTFLSQPFAKGLLAIHLALLAIFGLFRWTAIGTQGPRWIFNNLSKQTSALDRRAKVAILGTAFTSNVIGILCSRSLHYQFYSWYFHQVPLLLWFSKLPVVLKLVVPVALEWCWNVFPSTENSSLVLLVCHLFLVSACFTLPGPTSTAGTERILSTQQEDEQDEVDALLSNDGLRPIRKQAVAAHLDTTYVSNDEPIEHDDALQRLAEARATKAAKEAKLRKAFQRRIATRRKVLALLGRFSLLLRPLLVIFALALIFVVPHPQSPVSKGTYVDENALQPAQARVYWDYFDVTYADMLSEKISRLRDASSAERADLVHSQLQSYGLDVHRQQFNYDKVLPGNKTVLSGTNVYARSATPRIDGREAVILTASWRSRWLGEDDPFASTAATANATRTTFDTRGQINVRGIASILALARYLTTQAHLSKDLIFVISDGHLEGIHAWSSAYFGNIPPGLQVEAVAHAGSQVWNAISIDYPSDSFSSLQVQYEGFDGQLPNMDVINTIVRIAQHVAGSIPISFAARSSKSLLKEPILDLAKRSGLRLRPDVEYELDRYQDGLRSAIRQVWFGVVGQASGPHGFFQRNHVDAITIYAVPATGPYGFFHMGRVIESFVRSMSNLIERLHHSQFFYLLLNPSRFVPIGTAILVPLFLSVSLTISGLAKWFDEQKRSKAEREAVLLRFEALKAEKYMRAEQDVMPDNPTLTWYRNHLVQRVLAAEEEEGNEKVATRLHEFADALRDSIRPNGAALACVASALVLGAALLYHADTLAALALGSTKDLPQSQLITLASIGVMALAPAGASMIRIRTTIIRRNRIGSLLLAFAYLQAGLLVALLSVLNLAQATVLALLTYSALRIASLRCSAVVSWLRFVVLTMLHPVMWALALRMVQAGGGGCFEVAFEQAMMHWMLFGSATVPIVCLAYLPIVVQAQLAALLNI